MMYNYGIQVLGSFKKAIVSLKLYTLHRRQQCSGATDIKRATKIDRNDLSLSCPKFF